MRQFLHGEKKDKTDSSDRESGRKYSTDFIITTSVDGHLKLWKKQDTGIEFVKHYRAHMMPIVGVSASADGQLFASIAEDESAKVFDVVNFGPYGCHLVRIVVASSDHYITNMSTQI